MAPSAKNKVFVRNHLSSVASIILLLGVGGVSLSLAGCGQESSYTVEEHMDRAKEFRIKGDLRAATLELKNVLKENPDSMAARLLLGLVYIDLEDGVAAEKELQLAKKAGVDAMAVMVPLAQSLQLQGEYDKILKDVTIQDNLSPGTKAALHVVHGDAYRGLGRYPDAEQSYRTAISLNSSEVMAYVGLANVAIAHGKLSDAKRYRDQAVRIDPQHIKVLTLDGDIASAAGDFKAAATAYEKLIKLRPDSIFIRTVLAWSQVNSGQVKEARKNIDKVLELVPQYPPANHVRAVIAYQDKKYQDASEYSEKVLAVDANRLPSILLNGASNFALGRMEQAYSAVNRYVTAIPGDISARKLLARIQMKLGRSDEAVQVLKGIAGNENDAELLSLLAQASLQKGDLAMGRSYLEQSLTADPKSASTTAQLGMTQIASGNVEKGLGDLQKSVSMDPKSFEKHVILALEQLRAKQPAEAIATAKKIQKLAPDRATGFTLEGIGLAEQKDLKGARKSFETALEVEPGNPNASLNLVQFAMKDNKPGEAKRLLEGILKVHPTDQKAQLMLADLARHGGEQEERMVRLLKAVEDHPEAREPAIFLAQAYLETNDYMKALSVTQKVLPIFPKDPALLEVVGQAEMRSGQPENAIITFSKLAEAVPMDAQSHYLLGSAFLAQKNLSRARTAFENALKLNSKHASARFAMVQTLANLGQVPAASTQLSALIKEQPAGLSQASLYEAQGYIDLASKDYVGAAASFEKAFDAEPNNINLGRLSEARVLAGKPDEAVAGLNAWLVKYPNDMATRFQMANLKLGLNRLDGATRDYELLLKADKDNPLVLNNLAWIQLQKGQTAAAVENIEKALVLRADSVDILDTAGSIYLSAKRPRDAVTVLRKAVDLAPQASDIRQHYAEALIADGKKSEAATVLKDLLNGSYALENRKQAEILLVKANSK